MSQPIPLWQAPAGRSHGLTSPVIPFFHFNRVMGLGLTQPATERELDDILAFIKTENIKDGL